MKTTPMKQNKPELYISADEKTSMEWRPNHFAITFFWRHAGLISFFSPWIGIHLLIRRAFWREFGLKSELFVNPIAATGIKFFRFTLGPFIVISWQKKSTSYFIDYIEELCRRRKQEHDEQIIAKSRRTELTPPDTY